MAISTVAASILMMMSAQVAKIYNKDSNKLDLYGKVGAKHYFSSNDTDDSDTTYIRLGFKGKTRINDQLAGFGQWEYKFRGNHAESQGSSKGKTRLAFAGLRFGDYGSINYGRNYGVAYNIGAWIDVLPEFGGDTWTQADVLVTGRTTGVATYRNNDSFGLADGLNFAARYQGRDNRTDVTETSGDGFSFSTTHEYEGFGIGTTHIKSDRTNDQIIHGNNSLNAPGQSAEVQAAGLKYDTNNTYLATACSEAQNMTVSDNNRIANKTQNSGVVTQYQFDFGLRPFVAYLQSRGEDLGTWDGQDLVKYIDVGTTYYFNKDMSIFVGYKINLIDKSDFTKTSGVATDSIVTVGLVYQF